MSGLADLYRASHGVAVAGDKGNPSLLLLNDAEIINHALQTPTLQDKAARDKLWNERYQNSADLQAEFPSVGSYAAFMNADFAGRVKIIGRNKPGGDIRTTQRGAAEGSGESRLLLLNDAEIINHALQTPTLQDKAARDKLWNERYQNSADLQAEFPSVGSYAAFMNADFAGRVKIIGRNKPGGYTAGKP